MRNVLTLLACAILLMPAVAQGEKINHAKIIRDLDEAALQRGQKIYESFCFACHGKDGKTPTNPLARSFADSEMKNGADPYSLWKTVTFGFNTMPATQASLTPRQRYDVIHYLREAFLKPNNPGQYTKVDPAYLESLPVTDEASRKLDDRERDYGPVLAAQLVGPIKADHALHFRLPDQVTFSYDMHTMRSAGAWTGGFLDLSETHHYKQRGERMPKPNGQFISGLQTYGWLYDGQWELSDGVKEERAPLDSRLLTYRGHYLHDDQAILSYAVEGRDVLETIGTDRSPSLLVLHHTLRIESGDQPIQLAVAQIDQASGGGVRPTNDTQPIDPAGPAPDTLAYVTGEVEQRRSRGPHTGVGRHTVEENADALDLGTPGRTVFVRFRTSDGGTLIASAPETGQWKPNGKTLFVKGRLVFDIGWVGAMQSKRRVDDGKWHTAALVVGDDHTRLYVDGRLEATRAGFRRKPVDEHVLKIGATAVNFGGDYQGDLDRVVIYDTAMDQKQVAAVSRDFAAADAAKLLDWSPQNQPASEPKPDPAARGKTFAAAAVLGDTEGLRWHVDDSGRVILTIPASKSARVIRVARSAGSGDATLNRFSEYVRFSAANVAIEDPKTMTRGGPQRWSTDLTVEGKLGEPINGYALDTIPVPFENPYNAWMRTSAVDFFEDGRAAVSTHGGDVWIVSGIDQGLKQVTWSRFVAGLFEPFGVKVVDGVIYVTCRDGIKRLHNYDGNGEADFVEAFHVDQDVSRSFHAYNFDLQTDSQGNFYFAKAGQYTQYDRPGTIMKVPPTGGPAEIVSWGIRTPNGMGALPGDRFTVSDNQGPWMPAGKISMIVPGEDRFFGNMPNKRQEPWVLKRTGGQLPETFDEPFIWMPQELDNSCGGQVWVDDKRWGPLGDGRLIHSSFGKGWLYYLSLQPIDGRTQSSIVALPHQWDAGVMRLRVNPTDGQVYGVGLSGWQGPSGGADGCFQRLRYVGGKTRIIERTRVTPTGIELTFNFAIDTETAAAPERWQAEMWNYKWSKRYGSDQFSVRQPDEKGHDTVRVTEVRIHKDHRTVHLTMPDLAVCDQLRLDFEIDSADGVPVKQPVYFTIHGIPEQP